MQKYMFVGLFLAVGCASSTPLPSPSLEGQISLRRVRVFMGPIAYVGQAPCSVAQIDVPKMYGVDAVAFLENDESLAACGKKRSSVIVPSGDALRPDDYARVRSRGGFVVACVEGDSRPSELVLAVKCVPVSR